MVTATAAKTLAVTITLSSFCRQRLGTWDTAHSRLQPAGVKSWLRRSVYARGSANGRMAPRRPRCPVFTTRHLISFGSNGTSSWAARSFCSSSENFFLGGNLSSTGCPEVLGGAHKMEKRPEGALEQLS